MCGHFTIGEDSMFKQFNKTAKVNAEQRKYFAQTRPNGPRS